MRICFVPSPSPSQSRVGASLAAALRRGAASASSSSSTSSDGKSSTPDTTDRSAAGNLVDVSSSNGIEGAIPAPMVGPSTPRVSASGDAAPALEPVEVEELVPEPGGDMNALAISLVAVGKSHGAVLIHIDNAELLEAIVQLIRYEGVDDSASTDMRPTIVVISSLNTWCGRLVPSEGALHCSGERFCERRPHPSALRTFALENRLFGLQAAGLARVRLIATGLVYGDGGLHFESVLRCIYEESGNVELVSTYHGQNVVPMIHVADLAVLILRRILVDDGFAAIATDGSVLCLRDVLVRMGADVGGTVRFQDKVPTNGVSRVSEMTAWSVNIVCEIKDSDRGELHFPSGLSEHFPAAWSQFVASNNLQPSAFVIAGPPLSGKTAVAQELCSREGLRYVCGADSIRYVLSTSDGRVSELRTQLQSLLEAKVQEASAAAAGGGAKKGGKAGAAPTEPVAATGPTDFTGPALTAELCAQVPDGMLRSCLFSQISFDGVCQKKGYVVDSWLKGISAASDVSEALLGQATAAAPADSGHGSATQLTDRLLCIELQANASTLSQRFLRSIGLDPAQNNAKLGKDQQASISKFDTTVKDYFDSCLAVSPPSYATASSRRISLVPFQCKDESVNRTHKAVAATEGDLGAAVLRVATSNERLASDVAEDILSAYRTAFGAKDSGSSDEHVHSEREPGPSVDSKDVVQQRGPELGRSLDSLNVLLSNLATDAVEVLAKSNSKLQSYFIDNLFPHLSEMLVRLERERPEDPLRFASAFLDDRAASLEAAAEAAARERFLSTVQTAATLETRAANELLSAQMDAKGT